MTRIPVWKTSVASLALVLVEWRAFLRLGWVVLAAMVVLQVVPGVLAVSSAHDAWPEFQRLVEAVQSGAIAGSEEQQALAESVAGPVRAVSVANLLSMVAMLVGSAMLLVVWTRFAALGDRAEGRRIPLAFGAREIETVGAILMVGIGAAVAAVIAFVVSLLAVEFLGDAGYAVMAVIFTALFLVGLRLTLLIPHAGCDGGLDVGQLWRLTRGQTLRIFGVYGLVSFVLLLVGLVFLAVLGLVGYLLVDRAALQALQEGVFATSVIVVLVAAVVVQVVFGALQLAITAAMLGLMYGQLAPERAGPVAKA